MLWDRYGVLPRHLIFIEVTHVKAPYIDGERYQVKTFDRDRTRGVIGVELSFGFMEEPDVEHWLEDLARHRHINLSPRPRQWMVHVANENLLPGDSIGLWKYLRFRLFLFLRLVSRPAYYYYGLGDKVQLSAEIFPVRVN
jgi:KUP system potassium uptake protein